MDIRLLCRSENEAVIKDMLAARGIGVDEGAGVVMAEKGLEQGAQSDLKIVFTMHALPGLFELFKNTDGTNGPLSMLVGKSGEAYSPISIEDVVFFNAVNNNVYINDAQQKQYCIKHKLYQLESMNLPHYFIRINKSEIVNIKRVRTIVPMFKGKLILYLEGYKNPLDISRNYTKAFKERLGL